MITRHFVDLLSAGTGAVRQGMGQRVERGLLCPRHKLVDREVLDARLAHEERSRHVRPIAGNLCAEVEQDHLT